MQLDRTTSNHGATGGICSELGAAELFFASGNVNLQWTACYNRIMSTTLPPVTATMTDQRHSAATPLDRPAPARLHRDNKSHQPQARDAGQSQRLPANESHHR